ncbi:MAG: YicC family protein [Sedimentisphaerales bacterium]|nr:YicC family protein [Sedimentisphaerales bacterium]
MIRSMTGYGLAEGQLQDVIYTVEIRALNNRYFKASIKLPEMAAFLEANVEKLLREELVRGTINYVLRLKNADVEVLFDIDQKVLGSILKRLSNIMDSANVHYPVDITALLSLPGVLAPVMPRNKQAEKIRQTVFALTVEAMANVKQMRVAEGAVLADDLQKQCEQIHQNLELIKARSLNVLKDYRKKLRKRVDALLAEAKLKLDEDTLAREVAVFAERSDISEEIARLGSHLQQFVDACKGNGQAGRRLEFISQEMLREANTLASKAGDAEIARSVLDMKCRIDRIKEQVQNIE